MKHRLTVALAAVLVLSSCGMVRDSRVNPFNWFGGSEPTDRVTVGQNFDEGAPARDPRLLAYEVVSLNVDRYSTGAIIRATGVMESQGWWKADLVEVKTEDPSHLVLDFRILPPPSQAPVGSARSREVTVATTISPSRLENISRITVQGEKNARSTGR